jgi:hypothetical protein
MQTTAITRIETVEELDARESNGISVTLVWNRHTNAVSVIVGDARTEESFVLDVAPDRALDAFHHPFAYSTCRRSDELALAAS